MTVSGVSLTAGYLFTTLAFDHPPSIVGAIWQLFATSLLFPFANRLIDRFDDADVRFR
jgi:rod shape-determining protein MreD